MFAGHVGAALAVASAARQVNPGTFVAAALLLDIALWLFVLLGWESVAIPADFASTHQPEFIFPWSHGLLAALVWSAAAAVAVSVLCAPDAATRWRAAALVFLATISHWFLDALVHRPEMPLAGAASPRVGLGLAHSMSIALAAEAAIVVAGLWLFLGGSSLPRGRLAWLALLCMAILAATVAGMTVAPPPPSTLAMAASSLLTIVLVCALVFWLGRQAREAQAEARRRR